MKIVAVVVTMSLAGCTAVQNVADPGSITLEKALVDTVDALSAARARSIRNKTDFGFYGCTVTAVFNISATATQDNKVTLTAAGPPANIFPIALNGMASSEGTASGMRGNTVTVVLGTKYCLTNEKAASGIKGVPKKVMNVQ